MTTNCIHIAEREIGTNQTPYIIAEISGNHRGEIARAFRLIDEAKRAGADAVKLQTYTADTMTIDIDDPAFRIDDPLFIWMARQIQLHPIDRSASS